TPLLLVVRLHDLPRHIASRANPRVARAPLRIAEELADPIPVSESVPVDVVLRIAIRIDHGDELQIGTGDEPGVDLTLRLRAAADLGKQDHVAWGDVAGAAENATGHDRHGRDGADGAEERPTIHGLHRLLSCNGALRERVREFVRV